MAHLWRSALGPGRQPSDDQEAAIVAARTGLRSVNAGAGTGKTSTLALRAVYLIESGHLRADQIVVVTFTKKAAAEIGGRIADTIERVNAAGAALASADAGVACMTIHALAAQILREFAFEDGATAPLRAMTDGEAYAVFHHSFRALLDGALAVDASVFPIAEVALDVLERDLATLALRLKNHGIAPATFVARALDQANLFETQTWGQLWSAGKNAGSRIKVTPDPPVSAAQRAGEAERERANIHVAGALFADFDRRLRDLDAATYGDLIGRATSLLNARPALVTRLRERWRYLLLDESQDTSELQLDFIQTLFGKPGEPGAVGMMPVGDTRQAIYGFNGADERVMERLATSAHTQHPLLVNRRSPQEIVDAAHAVLEAAGVVTPETPKLHAAAGSGGIACVRLQTFGDAGGTIKEHVEREAGAIGAEIERLLSDGLTQPQEIAILVRRRTHAAAYVRALNARGIYAALDRRSGLFVADEIRDALAWLSLLVDVTDRQAAVRIFQSPLCGLNDATLVALAAHPDWLERIVLGRLEADVDADTSLRLDRVRALLTELLPAVALPLPQAIPRIFDRLPIAAGYIRFGPAVGAQAIVNLRRFEELAREFAAEQPGARIRDFVQDAKRRILYDDDPQEPELTADGVRILTIHQAKGLEWPYVFVACSTKTQYADAEPTDRVIQYDVDSGAFALKNDVDGRETFRWLTLSSEHDPKTGRRLADGPRKCARRREQARVFYVAITRAQRRVYITAPAPAGIREAPYLAAIRAWADTVEPDGDLRFDRSVAGPSQSGSVDATDAVATASRAPSLTRRPIVERAPRSGNRAAPALLPRVSFTAISAFATCPRMARLRYRLRLPDLRQARPRMTDVDWVDGDPPSNAARLGSLAHRALELWGAAIIAGAPVDFEFAFENALLDFAAATIDEIERARAGARHAVTVLATFTLLEVEAPFELVFGDTRVEGFIDLIARDAGGRIVVIDYKTGRTGDEHYALQLAFYRRAATQRYPGEAVTGAILRLAPEGATLSSLPSDSAIDLEAAIVAAGRFESDRAHVGPWCASCAYRASPCTAPLAPAV